MNTYFRKYIPRLLIVLVAILLNCNNFYLPAKAAEALPPPLIIPDKTASYTDSSTIYNFSPVPSTLEHIPSTIPPAPTNPYGDLKIPTQVTKIGNNYFLVDCYHNQVVYSNNLYAPMKQWKVLTNDVEQPHTVASDGTVYLVDDTENNRIMIFEQTSGRLFHTQTLPSIGNRPHYIVYDAETASFFAWSSLTGEMYIIRRNPETNRVYLAEIRCLNELNGYYVRSFTIFGNEILFPSGNNSYIIRADKNTFQVKERYAVPSSIAGMAQIVPIGDYFYCTVSTDVSFNQNVATILRTPDLSRLAYGEYEDLFYLFGKSGTPYYISQFDNSYYLTHHRTTPGMWRFNVNNNIIQGVQSLH